MRFPGYELAAYFVLEIEFEEREDIDNLILSTNSFPLPDIASEPIKMYWGPGVPPIEYPGRIEYTNVDVELTQFYEKDLFFTFYNWNQACREDYWSNVKDGWVIGYSDSDEVIFKAMLSDMWPSKISKGNADKSSEERIRMSITLSIREITPVSLED